MKKLIIIIVLLFSTLFNGSLTSAATADYDHNELLDYPGYGEAMYESIVEQTTFISGRYTENKEYVNESINAITDYAKGWWDEYERISNMPPKEKLREMLNAAGGYALTVGDFIKNLFTDAEKSDAVNPKTMNNGILCKNPKYPEIIAPCDDNYNLLFSWSTGDGFRTHEAGTASVYVSGGSGYTSLDINSRIIDVRSSATWQQVLTYSSPLFNENDVSKFTPLLSLFNVSWSLIRKSDKQIVQPSTGPFTPLRNHVVNNTPTVAIPQPTAYLSCPDGTRINMSINGGTFLDVNGQVMQVNKDGTATVSSQICNLGWEKPTIGYVDGTDQVGISTPDGKTIDAETGEQILLDGEIDDSLEGCDGVLCGIGKLLSGLASIAKSIAGLVGKILDGLLALFVPDNLDFVSEEFDKMSAKFTDKFSLLTGLKDTITGVFQNSDSGNPLSDVNMSLPAAPGFNFNLDTITFIEPFVPRVKQLISGILFLMTIIYVYRKITGRGGVMEK